MHSIIPSGVIREIPAGQVVVSMTNRQGEITGTNGLFAQISGYSEVELIGKPHNVSRHPESPGGLFHLIWNRLETTPLVSAYIQNLALDGASYWAFAVIVPVSDDQFLSVGTDISRGDLHGTVRQIYETVRAAERKMASAGMQVRDVAAESSRVIEGLVADAGFASYDAMMAEILPLEVASWRKAPRPTLPPAFLRDGHEIGRVLAAAKSIDEQFESISADLQDYVLLADQLGRESASLQASVGNLARVVAAAAEGSRQVAGSAPVLVRASAAAASLADEASVDLQALPGLLTAAQGDLMQLRQHLAVAILHNAAAESYAVDIARNVAPTDAMASLGILCTALEDTAGMLDREWTDAGLQLLRVADTIDRAADRLANFQRMLLDWRNLVVRFRLSGALSAMLADVDQQETRSRARSVSLRALALRCRAMVKPLAAGQLKQSVAALRN